MREEQYYYFTFGNNTILHHYYLRLRGTEDSTRERMISLFGDRWSGQYDSEESAGVIKHDLLFLKLPKSLL